MTSVGPNGEKYCLFGRLLYKYREDGHFVTCEVDHPGYTEEERNNKENVIQLELSSGAAKPQWICIRKKNKACLSQEFTANLENSNNSESRIVPVYFPKGDFRPVLLLHHMLMVCEVSKSHIGYIFRDVLNHRKVLAATCAMVGRICPPWLGLG